MCDEAQLPVAGKDDMMGCHCDIALRKSRLDPEG